MQHQVVSRDEWLAARLGLAAISGYPTARPAQGSEESMVRRAIAADHSEAIKPCSVLHQYLFEHLFIGRPKTQHP